MFNNLIESSSHASEFKRRGSFFLFTSVTYLLLFVIAGVASIYAYDARLEDQNTEIVTLLNPVEMLASKPPTVAHNATPPRGGTNGQNAAVRENPMASVNRPDFVPPTTSAQPNPNPPVPDVGPWTAGAHNSDPEGGTLLSPDSGSVGGSNHGRVPAIEIGTPPPAPVQKPKPKMVHKSVINGEAISLPKPPYPPLAKQMGIHGTVNVQVLIDETGKVISAKAVSGNAALVTAAQRAAMEARFSPTLLGEQPVKVSGVITYNFVLQ